MHPDLDTTYHMGLLGCFGNCITSLREIPVDRSSVYGVLEGESPGLCPKTKKVYTGVQVAGHLLRDLSVEAFQLGVKTGHKLKYLLLGKESIVVGVWVVVEKSTDYIGRLGVGSALTWTATPKLFPSSIRGICSCNHVVTWREGMASKPHQLPPNPRFPSSLAVPSPAETWQVPCPNWQGPRGQRVSHEGWGVKVGELTRLSCSMTSLISGFRRCRRTTIFSLQFTGPQGGPRK